MNKTLEEIYKLIGRKQVERYFDRTKTDTPWCNAMLSQLSEDMKLSIAREAYDEWTELKLESS